MSGSGGCLMCALTLKINDWTKVQNCFSNISACIYPSIWFSAQDGPLDIRFEMRQTPTMEASDFWRHQAKTMVQSL